MFFNLWDLPFVCSILGHPVCSLILLLLLFRNEEMCGTVPELKRTKEREQCKFWQRNNFYYRGALERVSCDPLHVSLPMIARAKPQDEQKRAKAAKRAKAGYVWCQVDGALFALSISNRPSINTWLRIIFNYVLWQNYRVRPISSIGRVKTGHFYIVVFLLV